jgi:hypothetical protein
MRHTVKQRELIATLSQPQTKIIEYTDEIVRHMIEHWDRKGRYYQPVDSRTVYSLLEKGILVRNGFDIIVLRKGYETTAQ